MLTEFRAARSVCPAARAQVSLQLTALAGDPQVDDVFIDPWNRG